MLSKRFQPFCSSSILVLGRTLGLSCLALTLWLTNINSAKAAVLGKQGLEIEGPQDRRGFFIGPGLSFGASYFSDTKVWYAPIRADLVFGGGITKRFTLGVDLYVGAYATDKLRTKVLFGGDVEATGFLGKGFFLRLGLGAAGTPDSDGNLSEAFGGKASLGYELWFNQSATMSIDASYDLRYIPGDGLRHSPLVGFRFVWY